MHKTDETNMSAARHTHEHSIPEGHLIAFVELKQQTHLVCGHCNTVYKHLAGYVRCHSRKYNTNTDVMATRQHMLATMGALPHAATRSVGISSRFL